MSVIVSLSMLACRSDAGHSLTKVATGEALISGAHEFEANMGGDYKVSLVESFCIKLPHCSRHTADVQADNAEGETVTISFWVFADPNEALETEASDSSQGLALNGTKSGAARICASTSDKSAATGMIYQSNGAVLAGLATVADGAARCAKADEKMRQTKPAKGEPEITWGKFFCSVSGNRLFGCKKP